jgi:hypothetical protein
MLRYLDGILQHSLWILTCPWRVASLHKYTIPINAFKSVFNVGKVFFFVLKIYANKALPRNIAFKNATAINQDL